MTCSRVFIRTMIVSLFLSLVLGCGPKSLSDRFDRAVRYGSEGRFEKAKAEFENIKQTDYLYESAKNAIQIIDDASNRKIPQEVAICIFKAKRYCQERKFDAAVSQCDKAISINKDYPYSYYQRALVYLWETAYDRAILDLEKVTQLKPGYIEAYINMAFTYSMKGNYDKAILNAEKAIQINSGDSDAYVARGYALLRKGVSDLALADFNKALELTPNNPYAYRYRGFIFLNNGKNDQAISDLNKSIEIEPRDAYSYLERGQAYYSKKNYKLALADFNKSIKIDPTIFDAYIWRGYCHLITAQKSEGYKQFPDPLDPSRFVSYPVPGNYDPAISDYTKAIKLKPDFGLGYLLRGYAYYYKQEYNKAWEDVHQAEKLGSKIDPKFLEELRKASGREK